MHATPSLFPVCACSEYSEQRCLAGPQINLSCFTPVWNSARRQYGAQQSRRAIQAELLVSFEDPPNDATHQPAAGASRRAAAIQRRIIYI